MKALTVKNPWAWSIIHAGKDVESRSQPTKYRGQLYIHASKTLADNEAFNFTPYTEAMADAAGAVRHVIGLQGYVIGTVDVIDCHHATECANWAETGSLCSGWALADHFHWVLAHPRPLACPFPEKGKLGLWNMAEHP